MNGKQRTPRHSHNANTTLSCSSSTWRRPLRRDTPLYQQIAARVGYSIATGRLRNGDRLPPLREAHRVWRVNLHTLRRAYQELEKAGLVRIHPRTGAVVRSSSLESGSSARGLLAAMLEQAERRFGLSADAVTAQLQAMREDTPGVVVAECSQTLAVSIAVQIAAMWRVNATSRLIADDAPPAGDTVSTYFHLRDLKRGGESGDVVFVHIRPGAQFLENVEALVRTGEVQRVALCETDASLAKDLLAELRATLGRSVAIAVHVTDDPDAWLRSEPRSTLKLISPRNWDRLSRAAQRRRAVLPVEYDVEAADLERLGGYFGWRRRQVVTRYPRYPATLMRRPTFDRP